MRKLEESELSDGDGDEDDGSFGSPSLTEAVKQPLFRKSKSQVKETLTGLFTYTMYIPYLHSSTVVKCNPSHSPSGVCHDAVSGWKGLSPPSLPQPGHHVAQSGTGCCWIQCHPVPQPCMMTPLCAYPFTFQPPNLTYGTGSPFAGAMCGAPDRPQSDCWAEPRPIWLLSGAPYSTHKAGSLSMQNPAPAPKAPQQIENKMSLWDLKIDFLH